MSNNVLEQSIEGISFIEKAEHGCTDLEESINQCVLLFSKSAKKETVKRNIFTTPFEITETPEKRTSNAHLKSGNKDSSKNSKKQTQPKQIKSILKTSKEKINEMKNKIYKIFEDNTQMINNITEINEKNQKELNDIFLSAQKVFEKKMDKLYEEKIKKISQINNEYDCEIFKLLKYCSEEKTNSKTISQDQSINELILEAVKKDREKEIKKIENEFTKRKRDIFLDFKAKADQFEEFTIDDRSVIYRNELFENLKDRINEVVSPEKKRVSIKLSGDEIIKQLQNSTIAN